MKEIPVLFSTPIVQAIPEGRKIQTRRTNKLDVINEDPNDWQFEWAEPLRNLWTFTQKSSVNEQSLRNKTFTQFQTKCPYGVPGDLLWVPENFRVARWVPDDGEISFRYEADGIVSEMLVVDTDESECAVFNRYWEQSCDDLYKAGYQPNHEERFENYDPKALRLRPNIFLPKIAARIWLQVTDVKVERLQDISEEDAKAEGVEKKDDSVFCWKHYASQYAGCSDARTSFRSLWQSINGDESWDVNPWVWVISFKVLSTTGKPK